MHQGGILCTGHAGRRPFKANGGKAVIFKVREEPEKRSVDAGCVPRGVEGVVVDPVRSVDDQRRLVVSKHR